MKSDDVRVMVAKVQNQEMSREEAVCRAAVEVAMGRVSHGPACLKPLLEIIPRSWGGLETVPEPKIEEKRTISGENESKTEGK